MTKTDAQLQHDVIAELESEPSLDHADIGVAVYDGVVTLSGFVKTYPEKMAAEKATRRVFGVRAIAEDIKVRYAGDPRIPDHEIAKRILDIFAWSVSVPDDQIKVKVEHGYVTLSGTVDWHYQSDEASRFAGKVHGVVGVDNLIEVRTSPSAFDVKSRIMAAIKRQADFDAAAVTVHTDGNKVTLGGRVKAWGDRRVAEQAAWAAPGVTRVVDDIVVAN
ncbi:MULTISPECIES: BON domain-containing protein [unclassified Sphingomonas]|uniref:BON domain-containing protein n=1 Tax=unclassified Sphingomonas TaxID=196159 RepID=UPI0006FFE166|nr:MULTISPECIES: BON domain-containing protein [unclassified Sphingomonas]KQX20048.1 ornithine aminotransferase [Sphingomonas sp. Root1294]KQY67298.1 ornithine aminotransferase [Sphingomonas sp. Root50]KRB90673.1 ornithine aminotransferase [Sphingomonas sp. Root720]